jgi:hypothetical protein
MPLCQVLGLALEFEGAPLRMERKQHYLARKIAERKAKKLGTSAEVRAATCSAADHLLVALLATVCGAVMSCFLQC